MSAAEQKKGLPEHYSPIMPYLVVKDADGFIEFIKTVFGAEEKLRVNMPDGSLMHGEYSINGGAIMLGQGLVRSLSPSTHPIYRRLGTLGDAQGLASALDREFAGAALPAFGRDWLVCASFDGLSVTRWTDVVWIYLLVSKNQGREMYRKVYVWSRDGDLLATPPANTPEEADRQLRDIAARAPWAEVGYSEAREKEWRRRRPDLLRRVDARLAPR